MISTCIVLPATPMELDAVNRMDRATFVATLGGIFENSPWVAEQAWDARPFATVDALHAAMVAVVQGITPAQQLALLRAHPELAGREARAGEMTDSSNAEQASAGLNSLTAAEFAHIGELNLAYRTKFGHPFIIAVRNHTKQGIFAAFARRLANSADAERAAALSEVFTITRLRLAALFPPAAERVAQGTGRLTTHVLDTARGGPAAGVRIDLSVFSGDGKVTLLGTAHTNRDGRTDSPLLAEAAFAVGRYELAFHVGAYFASAGAALAEPAFLDVIPIRFAIADTAAHYHVPLLVSPWSYSTYRGS